MALNYGQATAHIGRDASPPTDHAKDSVVWEVSDLRGSVADLNEAVAEMKNRLSSVMRMPPPQACNAVNSQGIGPNQCKLAVELHDIGIVVRSVRESITDILTTLDL